MNISCRFGFITIKPITVVLHTLLLMSTVTVGKNAALASTMFYDDALQSLASREHG